MDSGHNDDDAWTRFGCCIYIDAQNLKLIHKNHKFCSKRLKLFDDQNQKQQEMKDEKKKRKLKC